MEDGKRQKLDQRAPNYDAATYSKTVHSYSHLVANTLNFYTTTFEPITRKSEDESSISLYQEPQFIDIGCGCGRVTKELLLPSCPEEMGRLVAVDLCANMVAHARENNSHPKIVYDQLDITQDVSGFLQKYGAFDRLFCFQSLNRVKDQITAWKNIASLLKPGGECLLFYAAWYATPDIWRALAKRPRWSHFSELWESAIPKTQDMATTEERLSYARYLADAVGLELRSCEMTHLTIPTDDYAEMLAALIPGNQTLTAEERNILTEDTHEEMRKWVAGRKNPTLVNSYAIHALKPASSGGQRRGSPIEQ